jgi:hypothetical protein
MISRPRHFESLSIKDLLLARNVYHYHLMNKANVVGTAIGRYLSLSKSSGPIWHMLRNPMYAGASAFGKTESPTKVI